MSERKQTPDVLAAILNGEAPLQADFDAQALARCIKAGFELELEKQVGL